MLRNHRRREQMEDDLEKDAVGIETETKDVMKETTSTDYPQLQQLDKGGLFKAQEGSVCKIIQKNTKKKRNK